MASKARLEKILVVPDCHHPYVDRKAWRIMLAAAKAWRPERIITLGDFGDFYCVSSHRRDPNRDRRLEVEMDACRAARAELDALGARHKHFIEGNHCDRLRRYLADRAPELYNTLDVAQLLELPDNGWQVVRYMDHLKVGKVWYTHDVGTASARAHELAEADYQSNVVIGHTHRAALTYTGNSHGSTHVAIMAGWLGDAKYAEYLHRAKKTRYWSHAFLVGYKQPDGVTHFQLVPIVKSRVCLEGKVYSA